MFLYSGFFNGSSSNACAFQFREYRSFLVLRLGICTGLPDFNSILIQIQLNPLVNILICFMANAIQ